MKDHYLEKMKEDLQKIKKLQGKDRLEYLWTYYKYLLVILLMVVLVIQTVFTMIGNSKITPVLTVALVDTNIEKVQELELLESELKDYLGYTEKNQVVTIDISAYSRETDENIAKLAVVMSVVSDTDAVICNQSVYERYQSQEIFVDWKDILGEEYEKYKNYMIDGIIDLSLIDGWTEKQYTSAEESFFCVLKKSDHAKEAKMMLDYIISKE